MLTTNSDELAGSAQARLFCTLAAAFLFFASGCTTLPGPFRSDASSALRTPSACAAWFEQLDAAVDATGVRDAGAYRLPGFPYLRTDHFTNNAIAPAAKARRLNRMPICALPGATLSARAA